MTIPVVWYSDNPEAINRGYWDQAIIEDLLSGAAWAPPGMPAFRHVESIHDTERGEGAVVVVPARHHADPHRVRMLLERLDTLDWSLVVLTGDEEAAFPARSLLRRNGIRRAVWVQTPKPSRISDEMVAVPNGYAPEVRAELARHPGSPRPLDWYFSGQITHERRVEMAKVLTTMDFGQLRETAGFTQGVDRPTYAAEMVQAKLAPCPSGPITPDTFRFAEACEAGAIPIVDDGGCGYDYWHQLGGALPFPIIAEWAGFADLAVELVEEYPMRATRVQAWWLALKRTLAWRLYDDLVALGAPMPDAPPAITALVVTSPVESHPDLSIITETIESVRAQLGDAEIIVACDGVRPEQEHLREPYEEYLRALTWACAHRWHNVVAVIRDEWGHQANVTRAALDHVRTPLVCFLEHDTPLVGAVDWAACARKVASGEANVVRFYHEATIHPDHRHLVLGEPRDGFARTVQWSQRPHLARTDWYRAILARYFAADGRTMIEDVLHGIVASAWLDSGEPGWWDWRIFIYHPDGEIKRSTHLDARGSAPKYDMRFRYPGDAPPGAPRPS